MSATPRACGLFHRPLVVDAVDGSSLSQYPMVTNEAQHRVATHCSVHAAAAVPLSFKQGRGARLRSLRCAPPRQTAPPARLAPSRPPRGAEQQQWRQPSACGEAVRRHRGGGVVRGGGGGEQAGWPDQCPKSSRVRAITFGSRACVWVSEPP